MAKRANNQSDDSGSAISHALQSASDAIWVVSADDVVTYLNPAAVSYHSEFFGTKPEHGASILRCYPDDKLETWKSRYQRAREGERVYALDTLGDGESAIYYELVFDQTKGSDSVTVIARSLTDRRRTSTGTTFEARAIIDPDTYVLFANPTLRALIGLADGVPIRSLRFPELLDPEDQIRFSEVMSRAAEQPARVERLRVMDLKGVAHETVGTIARSPDSGNYAVALLDITHQIETELRLEKHAEHLQALHAWAAELNAYMERPTILYQRSLELLSNTVHFDTASVQLLKDDNLEIVACAGFPDSEKILGVSFPFDSKFPNWNVVTSRGTIALEDVGTVYPHFHSQADHYASGHICSWLGVPLGVRDDVLGMIALDRGEVAPFTEDETRLVATMAEHIAVAVHNSQLFGALQESEERLTEANQQKEVLLRELHHRSKNNMQMISSLLSLGAAAVSVEEDGRVLDDVRMRIQSLAAVHEELYRSENLDSVDLSDYAGRVTRMIVSSYGRDGVSVAVDTEELAASIDVSVPFGLILSELLLNAYKHAFPDFAKGTIRVELKADGDGGKLSIQDDGVGLSKEIWGGSQDSLGMQLVSSLVDQIGGSIDLTDGPGTKWVIHFPLGLRQE